MVYVLPSIDYERNIRNGKGRVVYHTSLSH